MKVDIEEMQNLLISNNEMLKKLTEMVGKLQQPESDYYMTINKAAEYLSQSPSTLRRYLKEIPHSQRDRVILMKKSDIDKWASRFIVK